ncbi:U3 small nucleolar RNA-associated protein 6-domain-containing protein [Scleroderma yunnanense]
MERVQFQQEQMLAELKDLVSKGVFTRAEVKQIMRKRTQFEMALVRRIAKKSDFLRYAAYEMTLEQLRRKRLQRLNLPTLKATISDYALVRRQFHIFERALRRFKADVGLWIQYIQVAQREGARSLVGRITARALQLHPNVPSLYIIAASHELSHMSPSTARALLQRGLRLNADSIDLWREYIRMELHFIEGIRRRWNILGISLDERKLTNEDQQMEVDITMDGTGDHMFINEEKLPDEVVAAEQEGDEGEAARRAIMEGAIVKSAMSNAAKAIPRIYLFLQLDDLIRTHPCQPNLRTNLLDELYSLLQKMIPGDPEAIKMKATRRLRELTLSAELSGSQSERMIDSIQYANEQLVHAVNNPPSDNTRPEISTIYAYFVKEWCQSPTLDPALKQYLISSLRRSAQQPGASSILQATHLRLLLSEDKSSKGALKLAKRYSLTTDAPEVWLARLDAEKAANEHDVQLTWTMACSTVHNYAKKEDVEKVWLWGLDHLTTREGTRGTLLEDLLKKSMRDASMQSIHETLLLRYISDVVYSKHIDDAARHKLIQKIPITYFPTKAVWKHLFSLGCAYENLSKTVLCTIYENWRNVDSVQAALSWAGWLTDHADGKEAVKVIKTATAQLPPAERAHLNQLWNSRLNRERDEEEKNMKKPPDDMPIVLTIE